MTFSTQTGAAATAAVARATARAARAQAALCGRATAAATAVGS